VSQVLAPRRARAQLVDAFDEQALAIAAARRRTAETRCATELGARPCAASSSRQAATAASVNASLDATP